jgi:NADH-quinone oxidoreductase subunit K
LLLSVALFGIGTYGLLVRRNLILVLMCVELMLNGVNISLVAFDVYWADVLHAGPSLAIFVITIAAAEIGLGLAILLLLYRTRGTIAVDEAIELHEDVQ